MRPNRPAARVLTIAACTLLLVAPAAGAQKLSRAERRIRDYVHQHQADELALLKSAVDIRSATLDTAGVRAVGALFARELTALGFRTRWIDMPGEMHRAGHLFAERGGARGKRLLLIGHLDTVVEGQGFSQIDSITAAGNGSSDMKGGDVAIIYALRALNSVGALDGKIVVSPIVPMGKQKLCSYNPPACGSATKECCSVLPPDVRMVSAFQTLPAPRLANLDDKLGFDVIVCADDEEAKKIVMKLAEQLGDIRALDGGSLAEASLVESLTPLLINLAIKNKTKPLSIKFV